MTRLMPWRSRLESIVSRTPFEDRLRSAFEGGRLPSLLRGTRFPPANVAETEGEYLISIELPGTRVEEIAVELTGGQLVVSGERERESEQDGKRFHRVECSYGAFRRRFDLPDSARKDPEGIHATCTNGMLEIRVEKTEQHPVAKIGVRSK